MSRGSGSGRSRGSPLHSRRTVHTGLIGLWMDVLRQRRILLIGHSVSRLATLQQLQASFDMAVVGIEFGSSLIGVKCIICLIIA